MEGKGVKSNYQRLRQLWKEAYPEKNKSWCETETIKWWNNNKKDDHKIQMKLNELEMKKTSRGKNILTSLSKSFALAGTAKTKSAGTHLTASVQIPIPDISEPLPGTSSAIVAAPKEADTLNSILPHKKPAQESASTSLQTVKTRMLVLLKAKNSGLLLSKEQVDELKGLKKSELKLEAKIKRLEQTRNASKRHREKKRATLTEIETTYPDVAEKLRKVSKNSPGRPLIERDQPALLDTILDLVTCYSNADERRRCETLRSITTLDNLLSQLKEKGFNISRSGLYLRLQPRDSTTHEGKRHISTVPVKLVRAQNTLRIAHQDIHFAAATVKYLKDIATLFGELSVCVISQDDKARIPLGLPAAHKQSPILMRMDYRVQLPDHDWVVATKHKLIPSVYAGLVIKSNAVSYTGPTYIALRSGKHDSSTALTHAIDLRELFNLEIFKHITKAPDGTVKPILILLVDGGPDENPRFPKTLSYAATHFQKFDLDALFVATHAPHQSASNPVERRMAPLSRDLCGLILPHDAYGTHLDSKGKTLDVELEMKNFAKAGQLLADVWSERVIDNFPIVAKYIAPPANCPAECADKGSENVRDKDLKFLNNPSFLTEKWKYQHVRQSQYLLQIVKCGNSKCCKPTRTNIREFFQSQFLPAPIKFKATEHGIQVATVDDSNGHFMDICSRLALDFLQEYKEVPFDAYCPSVQGKLTTRICPICETYHPTKKAATSHRRIHKDVDEDFVISDQVNMRESNADSVEVDGIFMINDLGDWLKPIFEEDLG